MANPNTLASWNDGVGYTTREYADSYSEFGTPTLLPNSTSLAIIRSIPVSSGNFDLLGIYPFIFTDKLISLSEDMQVLSEQGFVTYTAVINPFDAAQLNLCSMAGSPFITFKKFKPHVLFSLTDENRFAQTSRHHVKRIQKALAIETGMCAFLDDQDHKAVSWNKIQSLLNQKKDLTGLKAMTPYMIETQVQVPELEVIGFYDEGELHGITTWMIQGEAAFSHTTAMTDHGRKKLAGYAMYAFAIDQLQYRHKKLKIISLGSYASSASMNNNEISGLDYFKCGWSCYRSYSYLAMSILNTKKYTQICKESNTQDITNYFPAYRNGELL